MLLNDFYRLHDLSLSGNQVTATLSVNREHDIFKGHFPGRPVVPGVCMVQILKEITEQALGKSLFLSRADQIKFLQPLLPEDTKQLSFSIHWNVVDEDYDIHAVLEKETTAVFKFQGIFKADVEN